MNRLILVLNYLPNAYIMPSNNFGSFGSKNRQLNPCPAYYLKLKIDKMS
ncbi:MAG: hypothetical protein IPM34_11710 [Saprospiraceae bacterium]|nr:hypothetical protein [Saprospiraceae bacterium]